MKSKIIFIVIFICLICALKILSISKIDNKEIEKHLNSLYEDYEKNPDDYVIAKGKIIKEYDADDGLEISFYGKREWIVEIELWDGSVVETQVLRDKEDKIGDVIDIAYKSADRETLEKYINATQLHYIECFAIEETIDILTTIIKITMIGMIGVMIFFWRLRKRTL